MNIIYDGDQPLRASLMDYLQRAAALCVQREELDPDRCEISLSLVSPEEIRSLNSQFRGIDRETDVLSFPQYDDWDALDGLELIPLGDVVISDTAVRRQAEEYGHSYEREFVYLFVHSILHLLGYDHMEDEEKAEMRAAEEAVMEALGLSRTAAAGEAPDYRALLEAAAGASAKAYAPYSRFFVGAALLCDSGSVYTGVNVENASYGATICAERSAVSAAITAGETDFAAIAVYSPGGRANPCGICRQVLAEFGQDITVVTGSSEEDMEITSLRQLLPKGFTL